MANRSTHFFVTADDIATVCVEIESKIEVRYTRCDHFPSSESIEFWTSAHDIPDFGRAVHGKEVLEACYLVTPRSTAAVPRRIDRRDGTTVYAVDQALNPASVALRPGGVFEPGVVIGGSLGTTWTDPWSIRTYDSVRRALRKHCRAVRGVWVGKGAEQLGRAGARLTGSAKRRPEFDLQLDP